MNTSKLSQLTPVQKEDTINHRYNSGWSVAEITKNIEALYRIKVSKETVRLWLKANEPVGVTPKVKVTKDWEPHVDVDLNTGKGIVITPPQKDGLITDFSDILENMGVSSENFVVVGNARISKWQTFSGEWLTSYRVQIEKKNAGQEEFDISALLKEVRSEIIFKTPTKQIKNSDKTLVVPFADLQAGKVASRGDSKSLVERVTEKRYKLEEYALQYNCGSALFLDGGDIVESFENVASQGFQNDLSIMGQIELASILEQEYITMLAAHHDSVTVSGVPSNHGAWRKGKDLLGKPSDDWGLHIIRQIQRAYTLNEDLFGHVDFVYPDEYRKSINIETQGVGIGLVHGEDSSLAQMENWWAKQQHGASPVAESDILITNHYHTFGVKATGRSKRTGKQKYWISTPTLDNGSDWWANKAGSDSDPGLIAFVVDKENGFDLQSLTVL